MVKKAVSPPSPSSGRRRIAVSMATTKTRLLTGLIRRSCVSARNLDQGNAPSRARAKVMRPVTLTLARPPKKKVKTTRHAKKVPVVLPVARATKLMAVEPLFTAP